MKIMTLSVSAFLAILLSSCGIFQKNTNVVTVASQNTKVETVAKYEATSVETKNKKKKNKKSKSKVDTKKAVKTSADTNKTVIDVEQLNGEWTVSRVNGERVTGDERPYIYFEPAQLRFYGSGGCNFINGDFMLDGNKMEFTNMLSTQRMCDNAPFEYQINYGLSQVVAYEVLQQGNETYLSLYDKYNVKVLELRKHNMDFLNGAWQIVAVNKDAVADEALKLVIDIPELKLHGNTGCNIVNGELLIDADKTYSIQFMQLISTMKACPDQQLEGAILIALEEVESAKPYDDLLVILYDKKGNEVLKLKKIELK